MTGAQYTEILFAILIVGIALIVMYYLGVLKLPEEKKKTRLTVTSREQPPDQTRRQLIIKGRTFNYSRWDITEDNIKKDIKVGALYYEVPGHSNPIVYSNEFDPKKHSYVDPVRLFDENREYVTIIEEGDQTPEQVALDLARAKILTLERKLKKVTDQLEREGHSKEARSLHAEMVKGQKETGRSPTGIGQSPAPSKDAAQPIMQPQDDEDEEEEQVNI